MHDNTPPRPQDIVTDEDDGDLLLVEDLEEEPPEGADDESEPEFADETLLEASWDEVEEEMRKTADLSEPLIAFNRHDAAVFSCALHPNRPIAVTGSEDDTAMVWRINDGQMIFEAKNHKDSVTDVCFSPDGLYMATGDMSGELFVYKIHEDEDNKISFTEVWQNSMGDLSWMRWHFGAHVLFAGSESGEIYMWRIPSGTCKIMPGNNTRCEQGVISADGKKMFASYANGNLRLWDLKNDTYLMFVGSDHPMVHQSAATAVASDKDSSLFMSGDTHGKIVFCTVQGPVATVQADGCIECVQFSPSDELKIAVSGTLSGQIAIWDVTRFTLRTTCEKSDNIDGITRIKFITDFTFLATTMSGYLYGYDARSGVSKFKLYCHVAEIYELCYDQKEKRVLTSSEDATAKLFQLPCFAD